MLGSFFADRRQMAKNRVGLTPAVPWLRWIIALAAYDWRGWRRGIIALAAYNWHGWRRIQTFGL
jgi:hypothetical protein